MGYSDKTKHAIRFWLLRKLPTCKQTVEVISESMERPLSIREKVLLKLHLWVCLWCVLYLEHLHTLKETLGATKEKDVAIAPTPGLSSEARERIKRNLTSGN